MLSVLKQIAERETAIDLLEIEPTFDIEKSGDSRLIEYTEYLLRESETDLFLIEWG